jgi:hypothetical protein
MVLKVFSVGLRLTFPISLLFAVSCGSQKSSLSTLSLLSAQDGRSSLSGNCQVAIDAHAEVITLFLGSISDIQRKRNEELARQNQPHCGADLITSYSQTDEAPKGTIDLTITTPSSNSSSSYGYPSISSLSFSIVLKASLSFPLGTGTVLTCKNVFDIPAFVEAAIKLADSPVFQNQLNKACAK